MAEGDTIYRMAAGLRPYLVGRSVRAARTTKRAGVGRLIGTTVDSVDTAGKNLLIRFSNGLTIRTHLRMNGSWHRYRPGDRWQLAPTRAVLVLEVEGAVAVCFDAPVVELFETRAESLHPVLGRLGPDLLAHEFDGAAALARLLEPSRAETTIAEAMLDQRVMAGAGNVFRSEVLFIERVDPFARVASLDDPTVDRLIATARRLLVTNVGPAGARGRTTTEGARAAAGGSLWVYARAGRPCRRCGTPIRAMSLGADLPRTVWWCPRCQPPARPR